MDPATILTYIELAMKAATLAAQAEQDIEPFAVALYDNIFAKKVVTQAGLDALETKINELSAEFQADLPPE